MNGIEHLMIMRCPRCSKPFNKESTLKRHGYYCRSRKNGDPADRSKACIACAKAKARCDNLPTACTRCATRQIPCEYRGRNSKNLGSLGGAPENLTNINTPSLSGPSTSTSPEDSQSLDDLHTNIIIATDDISTCFDISKDLLEPFDWNLMEFDTSKLQPLDFYRPSGAMIHDPYDPALQWNSLNYTTSEPSFMKTTSVSTMPPHPMQYFTGASVYEGRARVTAAMMKRILTAYPTMMRNRGPPPPFIHSSFFTNEMTTYRKPLEALATCEGLMQLLNSSDGNDASRRLVWKNIRMECERVHVNYASMDRWELLASMQAHMIYMLLRLGEGETEYNNIDVPLLSAMWVAASALKHKLGSFECHSPFGLSYGITHDDWVFEESRRRWYVVFKCLGMLFTNDGSDGCTIFDSYAIAPLPAKKQLWDARDENQWLTEKSKEADSDQVFGLKVSGRMTKLSTLQDVQGTQLDLMRARPRELVEEESEEHWREWCSGMDDLGALIMLAASLRAPP